jgi:molecular chaperone DnaK
VPESEERRGHRRSKSSCRILWTVAGREDLQINRLRDVSRAGALVVTRAVARVGDEIRFDLLDEDGEKIATGLAKVAWVNPSRGGMGISFLSLGIDAGIIANLEAAEAASGVPSGRPSAEIPKPAPGGLGVPPKGPAGRPSRKMRAPKGLPPPIPGGKVGGPPPLPGEHVVIAEKARSADKRAEPEDTEIEPQIEPLAVRRTGVIIGIDLGTTNTCASYVEDGKPKIINSRTGNNTIPSMITFDPDGTAHVGQRAADRQILYPLRTVYGSKRLIGRTYRPELAAELQKHFAYPLAEADGQRFGVRIDDRVISMDAIAARVLDEVRATAEAQLGVQVEAAVITVPAYFSEVQREAVRRAAREAKLVVHRIVNEPTAAAVAYGHKQDKRARVAVWDFGGGTFDFSVVDVTDGQIEVVATGGDNFVGGSDFDDLLASYLLGEFQRVEGLDVDPEPQQIARLREAAEIAKRSLSVETDTVVELPEFTRDPKRALRVAVTRDRFEELTQSLIKRTVAIASEVMAARSISPKDVDDVLLVGGTTRTPAVQRAVAELFQRRPSKRINPDEAVALGAALLADEIGSSNTPTLLDILPMSVGYGAANLRFSPIVPRNSRLPTSREVTLDADLLGSVTMPIFQGESPDVSRNEYLFSAIVEDRSLWEKGRVTLKISFDEHCVMAVEAKNARTDRGLPVKLDRSRAVEDILRELGKYDGPETVEAWRPPESKLGKVFGKLFKLFRG